jgi:hypothetical protein
VNAAPEIEESRAVGKATFREEIDRLAASRRIDLKELHGRFIEGGYGGVDRHDSNISLWPTLASGASSSTQTGRPEGLISGSSGASTVPSDSRRRREWISSAPTTVRCSARHRESERAGVSFD